MHTYILCLKLLSLLLADRPNGKSPAYYTLVHSFTGYHISSHNSDSMQQPTTSYKQRSKLLPSVSPSTSMNATRQTQNMHQQELTLFPLCYALAMISSVDTSLVVIYACRQNKCYVSYEICLTPLEYY